MLRIAGDGSDATDPELETLLVAYWRPVHAYLLAKYRLSAEDARDTTQDFFVRILEGNLFERADRTRGRFRSFVKTALDHYVIDRARAERTQKRGGGRIRLSLEGSADLDDASPAFEDPSTKTPDEILDATWRRELVSGALEEIRTELEAEDRETYFRVFEAYFVAGEEGLDYRALAERHRISTSDVSNYLQHVKRRYRSRLRAKILETVRSDEDYQAELTWMFGSAT